MTEAEVAYPTSTTLAAVTMAIHLNCLRRPSSLISSLSLKLQSLQPLTAIRTFKPLRPPDKLRTIFLDGSKIDDTLIPPYPYGAKQVFKQADRGLYGGSCVQFGNKISKGRNKGKTRRAWYPNVRLETIRSEALDRDLTIRITAQCMRTIKKCGGLDQYLLGDKPARIKELGLFGWRLRWQILNAPTMKEELAKKTQILAERRLKLSNPREELANPGKPAKLVPLRKQLEAEFEKIWEDDDARNELLREQKEAWEDLRKKDDRFRQHVKTRWEKADKNEYILEPAVRDPNAVRLLAVI